MIIGTPCIYLYNYLSIQGYKARKVNCSCLYSAYILKLVLSGRNLWTRMKALNFDSFDNSHNSFLWLEHFIDFLCERWRIPCQASTLQLQYKRCVHLWNNFPCIINFYLYIYRPWICKVGRYLFIHIMNISLL